ncbi:MAG TPA: hypothetical protein PKD68_01960 [Candidatus Saccharibacteria bacterium]|nr:hypothetical protein [Candidatus Saccharibacteria bacterium]
MSKIHWRRWRPRGSMRYSTVQKSSTDETDPFVIVHQRLKNQPLGRSFWKRTHDFRILNQLIDESKAIAGRTNSAADWLYALTLQAPRAAVAQEAMDAHPHGYRNKEARLFELIDFNDAFVATILALSKPMLPRATLEIKRLLEEACKKAGTRCFSDEQYQAIVHGLSREIAVYLGLQQEGYDAVMSNRADDAMGVDMRVTDPSAHHTVNVDIKTRSSYHYRIEQLRREGRLSEDAFLMADRDGFAVVYNGHGADKIKVVVWRIDHEVLGTVIDFSFKDTYRLAEQMNVIMVAANN